MGGVLLLTGMFVELKNKIVEVLFYLLVRMWMAGVHNFFKPAIIEEIIMCKPKLFIIGSSS